MRTPKCGSHFLPATRIPSPVNRLPCLPNNTPLKGHKCKDLQEGRKTMRPVQEAEVPDYHRCHLTFSAPEVKNNSQAHLHVSPSLEGARLHVCTKMLHSLEYIPSSVWRILRQAFVYSFLPYFVFHDEFYCVYLYLFMEYLFVRCHVGASQTLPSGPSRVPAGQLISSYAFLHLQTGN